MTVKKLEIIAEPGKPTIITRRTVDAPRALVFEAFSQPEHLKRWMGPRSFPMVVCESDLRVGGRYRFVHRNAEGQEFAFSGEYKEIERPVRMTRTFCFEFMPGVEALETFELAEHDGRTTITTTSVHSSVANRDGHLEHGMEGGMTEGYARLDELLAELRGQPS